MKRILTIACLLAVAGSAARADEYISKTCDSDVAPSARVKGCTEELRKRGKDPSYRVVFLTTRAEAYRDLGRYEEAVTDITAAMSIEDTEGRYFDRGDIYRRMKRFDLAVADLDVAIRKAETPKGSSSYVKRPVGYYVERAKIYEEWGKLDKAVTDLEEAVKIGSITSIQAEVEAELRRVKAKIKA